MRDLPWVEDAAFETLLTTKQLSERERRICTDYHRDGFVVIEDSGIIDGIDVDQLWADIAPHYDYDHGRVQDAWRFSEGVRKIATQPAVLDTLRLLYEREPIPFQTLNFINGTEQATHSDAIHFSSLPSRYMCGVWVALEDITLRQGPLQYYEGSQRLPEFDYKDLGIEPLGGPVDFTQPRVHEAYKEYERKIDAIARLGGYIRRELAVKQGSLLIWSSNLLHGGSPRADKTLSRKSQVSHYYFGDTVHVVPMFSDRTRGEYYLRPIHSILDGNRVKPTLNGRPVAFLPSDPDRHVVRALDRGFSLELSREYLTRYPDVRESAFGSPELAFLHYVRHGAAEGREYFPELPETMRP